MNLLYAIARPFGRTSGRRAGGAAPADPPPEPVGPFRLTERHGEPLKLAVDVFPSRSRGARNDNKIVLGGAGSGRSLLLAQLAEAAHGAGNQVVYLNSGRSGYQRGRVAAVGERVGGRHVCLDAPRLASFNPFWFPELGAGGGAKGPGPTSRQLTGLAALLASVLQLTSAGEQVPATGVPFQTQTMLEQELASYYQCKPWLQQQGTDAQRSFNPSQAWHPLEGPGFNSFYEFALRRWAQAWQQERVENPATPAQRWFLQWLNRAGGPFYAGGPLDGLLNATPEQVQQLTHRPVSRFLTIDLVANRSFATGVEPVAGGGAYLSGLPGEAMQRVLLLLLHTLDARLAGPGPRLTLVLDELHYSVLGPHVAAYLTYYLGPDAPENRDLLVAWHEWPQYVFTADKPAARALLAACATQLLPAVSNPADLKTRWTDPLGLRPKAAALFAGLDREGRQVLVHEPARGSAAVYASAMPREQVQQQYYTQQDKRLWDVK